MVRPATGDVFVVGVFIAVVVIHRKAGFGGIGVHIVFGIVAIGRHSRRCGPLAVAGRNGGIIGEAVSIEVAVPRGGVGGLFIGNAIAVVVGIVTQLTGTGMGHGFGVVAVRPVLYMALGRFTRLDR